MNIEKLIPILLEQQRRFVAQSGGRTTAAVQVKRPSWADVYKNYPKNKNGNDDMFGPDFYKMIFGDIYDLKTNIADFGKEKVHLYNGCAGKVSMALSLSGSPIVRIGGVGFDFRGSVGPMKDKAFISTASKMKKWLDVAWKKNADIRLESSVSIEAFAKLIGNKKGIYLMLASNQTDFGASGHVTLWTGESGKWAFGGHHYGASAKAMYFWELK